jgi:16S rRNA (adenine1518-N6/adenine1519-N6)-dimethyltransferase
MSRFDPNNKLFPKRRFSQNFLKHKGMLRRIVECAGVDNKTVLEIGAGKGGLTRELAERAFKVYSVEIDNDLAAVLKALSLPNVIVVHHDFLTLDPGEFKPDVIVGNIPFSITTQILEKLVEKKNTFDRAVLTIQKEYGDRLLAHANEAAYGSISIFLQYHFRVEKGFIIPARFFTPAPRVNSMVVILHKQDAPFALANEDRFFKFVQGIFCYRRKSMKNALKYLLRAVPTGVDEALLRKRPQELTVHDFHDLFAHPSLQLLINP